MDGVLCDSIGLGYNVQAVVEVLTEPRNGFNKVVLCARVHYSYGEKFFSVKLINESSYILFSANYLILLIHADIVQTKAIFGNVGDRRLFAKTAPKCYYSA